MSTQDKVDASLKATSEQLKETESRIQYENDKEKMVN